MSPPLPRPWLLALAALLAIGGCAESSIDRDELGATTSTTTTTSQQHDRSGSIVVDVIDGDTFDVRLDDDTIERVRIIGINAPERGECLADEATAWLEDRIEGRAVILVEDRSGRDQYGRLLRYVEVDGVDVGEAMVADGLAIARRYRPDTSRSDDLEAAQRHAEREQAGLWAPEACGPASAGSAALAISEVRFDAEGPDAENANDEWVRIVNQGDGPIDLSGWTLRDESASNRYDFPDGFTLAPDASVTVRTGCGTDSDTDLHWCASGAAVWNNDGDTAFLLDPSGNVVDRRRA